MAPATAPRQAWEGQEDPVSPVPPAPPEVLLVAEVICEDVLYMCVCN